MEGPEVPTEQLHEEIHHHVEHSRELWVLGVALSSALLAGLAAVGALMAGHHANEAMLAQIEQLEKDAQNHLRTHQALAASVTMFQIAIAVGAIAVLIRRRAFWLGSLVVGAIGIVFFVQSFILGRQY